MIDPSLDTPSKFRRGESRKKIPPLALMVIPDGVIRMNPLDTSKIVTPTAPTPQNESKDAIVADISPDHLC